jgi:hypothetical protein
MAFNEITVKRISDMMKQKKVSFAEKKMFSGVCFMVNDKMCCGTHIDKKTNEEFLLCRIGEEAYENALKMDHVIPMEFTGRRMKGYVFVKGPGFKNEKDLAYWLKLCLDFNPKAQSSKKKSRA